MIFEILELSFALIVGAMTVLLRKIGRIVGAVVSFGLASDHRSDGR